ncbi:MAG: hypothetical protein AD742_01150 [Methylibium sp. NZG]|nr:MAG: hypothetical protein AD742_01150 [Methylibium sp. NZG]
MAMAGYSGTPLAKKLGLAEGVRVVTFNEPAHYSELLRPLPTSVRFDAEVSPATDLVHAFCVRKAELEAHLQTWRPRIRPDTIVWISWPKKASKLPTDITEDTVRAVALPLGFVDVKVCAVDEVWSGLKLVIRKALR